MIVTLAVRVLQIMFSTVTLALAVVLVAQYGPGHAPSLLSYGAFCGAASLIIALIGIAACFVEKLQGIVMLALDGLSAFFLAAGGIAYAAKLKVGDCNDSSFPFGYVWHIAYSVINTSDDKDYGLDSGDSTKHMLNVKFEDLSKRCKMAQADTAFIWFTFACAAGCVVLSFFTHKRGSSSIV